MSSWVWVVLAPHQSRNAFKEAPARIMNIAADSMLDTV